MNRRRICIVTGTRAEWGLLSGIARELDRRSDIELQIIATNMHLDPRYGHTVDEISKSGMTVTECIDIIDPTDDDNDAATVRATARCLSGMADAFNRMRPDLIVILGDRSEMLAVACAATIMRIPIAHLHGGEVTEGAIDDAIRHAITKMSSLHLVSTENHRRRVIQMGENPDSVVNTGAIGVYNALHTPDIPLKELTDFIGFAPDRNTLIVTYHPATLDSAIPSDRFSQLIDALNRFPDLKTIITYPNNDAQGTPIISMIKEYAAEYPGRVSAVPSLGMIRYMAVLRRAGAVVGNSSSGIIEAPSMGIPTVDIGIRQHGRTAADSVIHCGDTTEEIAEAIALAISPEMQEKAKHTVNPYEKKDTLRLCVNAIANMPLDVNKKFYDIDIEK